MIGQYRRRTGQDEELKTIVLETCGTRHTLVWTLYGMDMIGDDGHKQN